MLPLTSLFANPNMELPKTLVSGLFCVSPAVAELPILSFLQMKSGTLGRTAPESAVPLPNKAPNKAMSKEATQAAAAAAVAAAAPLSSPQKEEEERTPEKAGLKTKPRFWKKLFKLKSVESESRPSLVGASGPSASSKAANVAVR